MAQQPAPPPHHQAQGQVPPPSPYAQRQAPPPHLPAQGQAPPPYPHAQGQTQHQQQPPYTAFQPASANPTKGWNQRGGLGCFTLIALVILANVVSARATLPVALPLAVAGLVSVAVIFGRLPISILGLLFRVPARSRAARGFALAETIIVGALFAMMIGGAHERRSEQRQLEAAQAHAAAREQQRAEAAAAELAARVERLQASYPATRESVEASIRQAEELLAQNDYDGAIQKLEGAQSTLAPYTEVSPAPEGLTSLNEQIASSLVTAKEHASNERSLAEARAAFETAESAADGREWLNADHHYQLAASALSRISDNYDSTEDVAELATRVEERHARIRTRADQERAEVQRRAAAQAEAREQERIQAEREASRRFTLGEFRYVLGSMDMRDRIGSGYARERAQSGATFVVVEYTIENRSNRTRTIFTNNVVLVDSSGREFRPSSRAETALALSGNRDFLVSELQPGLARDAVVAFEVPDSVASQTFSVEFRAHGFNSASKRFTYSP